MSEPDVPTILLVEDDREVRFLLNEVPEEICEVGSTASVEEDPTGTWASPSSRRS